MKFIEMFTPEIFYDVEKISRKNIESCIFPDIKKIVRRAFVRQLKMAFQLNIKFFKEKFLKAVLSSNFAMFPRLESWIVLLMSCSNDKCRNKHN